MAKELPYFKFEPNQWENGNIQICSREDKGLFIDLCSMYWSRLGDVPFKLAVQKLCAGNATALNSLCEEDIFAVIDGQIFIEFLDEQLNEFENTSKQNSKNAREGWEKRRKQKDSSERNATASNPQSESDAIREEKRREDEIKEKKNKEKKESGRFTPPSLQEIKNLAIERNYLNFNAETFLNFYESKGWMVGKSKMKDWKASAALWNSRNKNNENGKINQGNNSSPAKRIATDFSNNGGFSRG